MSIRFVTRKWPPAMGGMETYSLRLVAALRAHGDVEVIALPGRKNGQPPGAIRLLCFGLASGIRLIFSAPSTVTHIGDMASWPLALAARLRSGTTRIALSAHGTDVSFPLRAGIAARLYGMYLRLGARLLPSAVTIANSQATAELAARHGFKRIVVVPLATDSHDAIPAGTSPGSHLLFVGRLVPRKGCAWFIRNVLPLLPPGTQLRVIGTVWDKDEAAALDLPAVTFAGPVYGDALIREYAAALCVVIPNIDVPTREVEGFGLTAVEAAAAGGLVLASRHSGLKEAVIDGVTGFHLPPGDPVAWAQKVREISDWTQNQRAAFVARATATTVRHYAWERVAQETHAAYALAPDGPQLPNPTSASGREPAA